MNCRKPSNVDEPSAKAEDNKHKDDGLHAPLTMMVAFEAKEKKDFAKHGIKLVAAVDAKEGEQNLWYNFTSQDGKGAAVVCREAYTNGKALLAHVANVNELSETMTKKKLATVSKFVVIAPHKEVKELEGDAGWKARMEVLKPVTPAIYHTDGLPTHTKAPKAKGERNGGVTLFVTITDIKDHAKFVQHARRVTELTSSEPDCFLYQFAQSADKKTVILHELYKNAAAVAAHRAATGAITAELLASGAARIASIEVHGSEVDVAVVATGFKALDEKTTLTYFYTR